MSLKSARDEKNNFDSFFLHAYFKITESLQGLLQRNKKRVNVIGFLNNTTSAIKSLKVKKITLGGTGLFLNSLKYNFQCMQSDNLVYLSLGKACKNRCFVDVRRSSSTNILFG